MLRSIALFLAANPYNITGSQINVNSGGTPDLGAGLANAVKLLMSVVGMLAIVFIIVAGIQMGASAGDPKRYQRGRDTLLYAVIGLVLAISAFAIVTFVTSHV